MWTVLSTALRDAGFVLWKYEGYSFQYSADPLVMAFGYIAPHRTHRQAIGGLSELRMFRYLVSVIHHSHSVVVLCSLDASNPFLHTRIPFPELRAQRKAWTLLSAL